MEYTLKFFTDFIKKLISFDNEHNLIMGVSDKVARDFSGRDESASKAVRESISSSVRTFAADEKALIESCRKSTESIITKDIKSKRDIFTRLQKCKETLMIISSSEKSITNISAYESAAKSQPTESYLSVDELLSGTDEFIRLSFDVNTAIRYNRTQDIAKKSSRLYGMCRRAEKILNDEIYALRESVTANADELLAKYKRKEDESADQLESLWNSALSGLDAISAKYASEIKRKNEEAAQVLSTGSNSEAIRLNGLLHDFLNHYPPKELEKEYYRIYSEEPSLDSYECVKQMPHSVFVSTLEYDISPLELSDFTKEFLEKYYYFMCRDGKLSIPHCIKLNSDFNFIFRFSGEGRPHVVNDACSLGMRLFMLLPPGKVRFTFIDPVTLGESFAMFSSLVDANSKTSEIINGKVWSAPNDIENKLTEMTAHISDVTLRCLQGKFKNLYEYNKAAEQNSEAYQILMLMDFPAGLSERSLKLLEQIANTGPKCGVFTVIYRNESQYNQISERYHPLISKMETGFRILNYSANAKKIFTVESAEKQPFIWNGLQMPGAKQLDSIIAALKSKFKSSDKVVIGFEKISNVKSTDSTKDGISIPIGFRGAQTQYLTLGTGGSNHALVAGFAGSGKSSLLHTIIQKALEQYSPDELMIYLVDFKRSIEFKIYADYVLPSFKVIAIESDREFGYFILNALDREQNIRADLFRKNNVDTVGGYRKLGKKMPRILVIMDEFHELFSNSSDGYTNESAKIMERIARQGQDFGIHMILASQSYSKITGIDNAVFDRMAVRIVFKCPKEDAKLLLSGGSDEVDRISVDDPCKAIYNPEAGNREYNSHFQVAQINLKEQTAMLEKISSPAEQYANNPTCILLSKIEDNKYCIFNRFEEIDAGTYITPYRLFIGKPLSLSDDMELDFSHDSYSNLLMIGKDSEMARSMFTFSVLSLCINYRITHGKAPEKPFIYLLNCKPFFDSYYGDTLKILAESLPEYIQYFKCGDTDEIQELVSQMYKTVTDENSTPEADSYFMVFGYQRADELKAEDPSSQIDSYTPLLSMMPVQPGGTKMSYKEMFRTVINNGARKRLHTVMWQDSFYALNMDEKDILSSFSMKIAFAMSQDDYSRFIGENDVDMISADNAVYRSKTRDAQKFRPYKRPDEDWLTKICEKLK